MELRVLRYFLVVAREENITKAAKLLHITQPTLSRQLMQLEEEFGVSLFRRSKHSIRLTEEGMLLRRRAQELVELADKTKREIIHSDEVISGNIAIGCGETVNLKYVAACMDSFRKQYPDVDFSLYTGIADDVKERIEQGTLDFGIVIAPVDISKYRFIPLPDTDTWVVVMKTDHPLAAKNTIAPADLEGQNLILPSRESVRNRLEHWFGSSYPHVRPAVYTNLSVYNQYMLVEAGIGVALSFDFNFDVPNTCKRRMEPMIENHSYLVWKKDQIQAAAMKRFIAYSKSFLGTLAAQRADENAMDK